MTEQEFRNKYVGKVVHCNTEEKAKELLKMAHDFGWEWPTGGSLIAKTNWCFNEEKTCYRIRDNKNVTYADRDFYVDWGREIVKFESEEKKVEKTKKVFDLGIYVDERKQRGESLDKIFKSVKIWALECHGLTEEEMKTRNKLTLDSWMKEVEVKHELSEKEIEVLKALKVLGLNWIARDEDNILYAYDSKPIKSSLGYDILGNWFHLNKDLFSFITWQDEEATNIEELLKKCIEDI